MRIMPCCHPILNHLKSQFALRSLYEGALISTLINTIMIGFNNCKDRFSEHHNSRHKFSACSGNPENVPDISVSQRRLRNVQAPGSTWSCTMVRGFRPTISVCLSCNCEDL